VNIFSDVAVTLHTFLLSEPKLRCDNYSRELRYSFGFKAIDDEFFALLFPGYAMIPYIFEPICCNFFICLLGQWRIKQDSRITPEYAERLCAAEEFEMINPPYSDIVVATSCFLISFLAPSNNTWKIFSIGFVCFATVLYCQCRVRIMRWQTTSHFGTKDLHRTVSFYFCLPLGVLAAALGVRLTHYKDIYIGMFAGTLAFLAHMSFTFCMCNFAAIHRSICPRVRHPYLTKKLRLNILSQ
jgi:hypothetical protein